MQQNDSDLVPFELEMAHGCIPKDLATIFMPLSQDIDLFVSGSHSEIIEPSHNKTDRGPLKKILPEVLVDIFAKTFPSREMIGIMTESGLFLNLLLGSVTSGFSSLIKGKGCAIGWLLRKFTEQLPLVPNAKGQSKKRLVLIRNTTSRFYHFGILNIISEPLE